MPSHTKGHLVSPKKRVELRQSLPEGPQAIFNHVVLSVDPDHFSQVDLPLLEQYATAAFQATTAANELAIGGAVIDGKGSPWLVVQEKSVRALMALSARLRICPQSRFDRLVAGANSRVQPHNRKPWLVGKDDEPDPLDEFVTAAK